MVSSHLPFQVIKFRTGCYPTHGYDCNLQQPYYLDFVSIGASLLDGPADMTEHVQFLGWRSCNIKSTYILSLLVILLPSDSEKEVLEGSVCRGRRGNTKSWARRVLWVYTLGLCSPALIRTAWHLSSSPTRSECPHIQRQYPILICMI